MHRSRAFAAACLVALGVLSLGRAEANHGAITCSVSPATVPQGGSIRVQGSTNQANETITIRMDGTALGSTEDTDDDAGEIGHFDESKTIPSTTATGTRTITIDRPGAAADIPCGTITVTAPTPTPSPTPTPTPTPTRSPRPSGTEEPRGGSSAAASRRGKPRLNVLGDDKFKPGERVKVTAARVTPNESYNLDFAQSPGVIVATGTSNRLGSVRFEFRIPSNARTGPATLTAIPADGSGLRASAGITIESGSAGGGGSSGGGKSLPVTGRNVAVYTTLAMMLLLGGLSMQRYEWQRKARLHQADSGAPKRLWG